MKIKKLFFYLFVLLSGLVLLSYFGKNQLDERLVGLFYAEDHPLEQPDAYTGYLALEIAKNGKFSLYDWSGNPGVSGKIKKSTENQLYFSAKKTDFDPPKPWFELKYQDELTYQFVSPDKLHLTYVNENQPVTIVFQKEVVLNASSYKE